MNKETRTFILGLILATIGGTCFYSDYKSFKWGAWNVINIIVDLYIMYFGWNKIDKTTD